MSAGHDTAKHDNTMCNAMSSETERGRERELVRSFVEGGSGGRLGLISVVSLALDIQGSSSGVWGMRGLQLPTAAAYIRLDSLSLARLRTRYNELLLPCVPLVVVSAATLKLDFHCVPPRLAPGTQLSSTRSDDSKLAPTLFSR